MMQNLINLHLGCGRNIMTGWTNLDSVPGPGVDVVADLDACAGQPLPFADNSVAKILAEHLIEHIRHPLPLMQELHRIASPGAKAVFRVPYGSHDEADNDPTHVRKYFLGSFDYFGQGAYWRADYGYRGDWQIEEVTLHVDERYCRNRTVPEIMEAVHYTRNVAIQMDVAMVAIKPARNPVADLQTAYPIQLRMATNNLLGL